MFVVAAFDPDLVRRHQHVDMRHAGRRLETVGGELAQEAERIAKIDRIHEAAVFHPAVRDAALVEADRRPAGR